MLAEKNSVDLLQGAPLAVGELLHLRCSTLFIRRPQGRVDPLHFELVHLGRHMWGCAEKLHHRLATDNHDSLL